MEEFLVGRCGKTEREAGLTSYREFRMLVKGKEAEEHERWELARWQAFNNLLLSPHIKAIKKPKSPKAWFRFPWERPDDDEVEKIKRNSKVTAAEVAELERIFADYHSRVKS